MKNVIERINELETEYIQFLIDICNIESPSDYKEGVDKVGKYICRKAEELGWKIEKQKQEVSGDCICITMNAESNEKAIAFSGHMDTVHPIGLFGEVPTHEDDEKIYGPGTVDCKGGIVVAFMAMRALHNCGFTKRPIKLILQSDEEINSRTSNKTTISYMAEKSKDCIGFFNCEGYNTGTACIKRKGISKYSLKITGKAAHAGECYNGISAIAEAAQKIIEFEKHKDPDGITFNCGTISGGTVTNAVPEECVFTIDIRFFTEEEMLESDRIVEEIADKSFIPGTTCHVNLLSRRMPMEFKQRNLDLLNKINKIFSENNMPVLKPREGKGGSDAADISAYGIPAIDSLGVEGGLYHSKGEFAYKKSITEAAKRLALIAYYL